MVPEKIEVMGSIEGRTFISYAVDRPVEAGNSAVCSACDEPVKFAARQKSRQIIVNVYENNEWDRVEHYHDECYLQVGEPYLEAYHGEPLRTKEELEELEEYIKAMGNLSTTNAG